MATRQEIQIAQDLVRFVNIMNDLLDCASWILKEIDPQTGNKLQIQEPQGEGEIGAPIFRDTTLEELKERGKRAGQNVLGYRNVLQNFITKYGSVNIIKALASWKINYQDLLDDITIMETEARNLNNLIGAANSKADLISFAESINANIPKLVLVRRSWCLGV